MRTLQLAEHFSHLAKTLNTIEQVFAASDEILHDKRNIIKKCVLRNETLVIKSFKKPNTLRAFIYGNIRDSKAKRSYLNAQQLIKLGIRTPKPVAFIENKKAGMLRESYFVAQYYAYHFTMYEVIRDFKNTADTQKHNIIKAFTLFTFRMHEKGILHLDHNAGNTLIKEKDGQYEFYIIDINRMSFKNLSEKERLNNFVRLTDDLLVMQIIADTYAECIGMNKQQCRDTLSRLKRHHMNRLNYKKRFKQIIGKGK